MNAFSSFSGLKVRTHCLVGYWARDASEPGETLTDQESCNNKCIRERDANSWNCGWAGWPQDDPSNMCYGNNNGKQLDRCMSTCWSPSEMADERVSLFGGPYVSDLGDKCFAEFLNRSKDPAYSLDANRAEWDRCVATFK